MAVDSSTFDAAAETARYLSALTPAQHAKAQAYTQGGHWLLLWGAVVAVVAAWLILKSGVLFKATRGVQRRRPRPWIAALIAAGLFFVVDMVLETPWAAYAGWWREKSYGLTSQGFGGWLGEHLLSGVIGLVLSSLFVMLVYQVIRKAPRLWPVIAGVLTVACVLALLFVSPLFIEPLFNKYEPAPPGPVRDMVVAMGRQVGVPTDKIYVYNGSKQSNRYTANVSGLFGTARVAMSDTMFAKGADLAEVRGVVGHEMGHYKRGHILIMAGVFGLLVMVLGYVVQAMFARTLRLLDEDARIAGLADPAGLPVAMMLLAVLGLAAAPVVNTLVRMEEADADRFSLVHFNEPDGLARALVKTIEYRAATPGAVEEFLFYDHPSVGARVRRAMEWKAAHPPS